MNKTKSYEFKAEKVILTKKKRVEIQLFIL